MADPGKVPFLSTGTTGKILEPTFRGSVAASYTSIYSMLFVLYWVTITPHIDLQRQVLSCVVHSFQRHPCPVQSQKLGRT